MKDKIIRISFLAFMLMSCRNESEVLLHPISDNTSTLWKIDSTGCDGYRKNIVEDSLLLLSQFEGKSILLFEKYFGNPNAKKSIEGKEVYMYFASCSKAPILKGDTFSNQKNNKLNFYSQQILMKVDSSGVINQINLIEP